MPRICYVAKSFQQKTLDLIEQANSILEEYSRYSVTVRTLFYQFVARTLIENSMKQYKRVQRTIGKARLAGLIDWDAIEDRVRNLERLATWGDPGEILWSAAGSYRRDLWATQPVRPEVWIEKNALAGVIDSICRELRVPYLPCVGYLSTTEAWQAGHRRFRKYRADGQRPLIIHLGDHDPSGLHMTQDIERRAEMFAGEKVEVIRIALNMDQVEQYDLPPNFAKESDRRYPAYRRRFGSECWELDALAPDVMEDLVREAILGVRDEGAWQAALEEESAERTALELISGRCDELVTYWDAVSHVLDERSDG